MGKKFDKSTLGQMSEQANERGWIVVYPDGIKKRWNDGRKFSNRRDGDRSKIDDVGFLSSLIDQIQADYGTDPTRVYATGISNGGFMSVRLATDLSDKIVAVAVVTAAHAKALEARKPTHPVGILFMNGTADPLVPYTGGEVTFLGSARGKILSAEDSVKWWTRHNKCSDLSETEHLPDRDPRDGTRVIVTRYDQCASAKVHLYRIQGGGHTWPERR